MHTDSPPVATWEVDLIHKSHLCYIRALKERTAKQDSYLESTERDNSTYEMGLVDGGFARARQSVEDVEARVSESHLVAYLAVGAKFCVAPGDTCV